MEEQKLTPDELHRLRIIGKITWDEFTEKMRELNDNKNSELDNSGA
jgi:hypothetical protein